MPSNSISTSLLSRQSPIFAMYVRPVSYCLYPEISTVSKYQHQAQRLPLTFRENNVFVQLRGKLTALSRLDPGVVIDCAMVSEILSTTWISRVHLHRPSISTPFS